MKIARCICAIAALLCIALPSFAVDAFMAFNETEQEMYVVVRASAGEDLVAQVNFLQSDTGGFIGQCCVYWPSENECVFNAPLSPIDANRAMDVDSGVVNTITARVQLFTGPERSESYGTVDLTDTLVAHVSPISGEAYYSYQRAENGCVPDMPTLIPINSAYCAWVCHGSYLIPIECEDPGYDPNLLEVYVSNGCAPSGEFATHCNDPLCPRIDWSVFTWYKRVFPGCRLFLSMTYCIAEPGCICIWRTDFYLPVEVMGFSQVSGDGQVRLNWATASETGLNTFIVARSEERDGVYRTVYATDGSGSATGHNYSWTDTDVENDHTYYYKLVVMDADGQHAYHLNGQTVILEATPRSNAGMPLEYSLAQNFPNPFNSQTNFSFSLAEAGHVTLKVFDLLGREVASVLDKNMDANSYTVSWTADGLPTGVYMYTLTSGEFSQTKKLLFLK